MKNNNVNININNRKGDGNGGKVGIFKSIFNYISNMEMLKIVKVYFVMLFFLGTCLAFYYAYSVVSDKEILREITQGLMMSDKERENVRDDIVTPKIQHELDILVYSLNADRAFIFELHNGKKNTTGLPFRFADMTYEEVNEDRKVDKIALQFQDIPLTLYKYPHYLQKQKVMIGDIDEIEKVDSEYSKHIRNVGGKYLGMIYMNNNGFPIGFLCVSYHNLNDVPSKELINNKLNEYAKMITYLLDLGTHINNMSKDNE